MILFIVGVLANALWQPVVIALIAWAVLKFSRCENATTRHAVWILALCASVAVPVFSALPTAHTHVRTIRAASAPALSAPEFPTRSRTAPTGAMPNPGQPPAATSALSIARPRVIVHPAVTMTIAAAWLVVMLALLVRLCVSVLHLERLKHNSLPLSVDERHALSQWARADKGGRDVRICVSEEIAVPVAIGIFDAMILLPSDFVRTVDPTDVDRILLHELAHIRRSDGWINLFERIVHALFFFSPGIYWISRQIDLEREVACDDSVLAQSAESVPYARCLARVAEMTQWPHDAVAAPGIFVTRKSISIRIERLLATGRDVRTRIAIVPSAFAGLALLLIMLGGGLLSPTVAYAIDSDASSPAPGASPDLAPVPIASGPATTLPATTTARTIGSPPPTLDYIDDLANAGLRNLDADDIIALKSLGVDGEYVRSMRPYFGMLSPRDLSHLKVLGVDQAYLQGLRSQGIVGFSAHDVGDLKALGVDGDYVKSLAAVGYRHLTPSEYLLLKSIGVDADYIRDLHAHGFADLTVDKLTKLKAMGVQP